jgi:hypothetical protein
VLQAGRAESDESARKALDAFCETFGLCIVAQRNVGPWLGYACRLYRAKKDSLSQAASAASNLRYELAARIARTLANLAAKAIAPFGKS